MVKITGRIEKYDDNNVIIRGKAYFIPTPDLKVAMTNFPADTIVTLATMAKQKGTVQGMAEPTNQELNSFLADEAAGKGAAPTKPLKDEKPPASGFQPASELPRKTAKEILQENLDRAAAEAKEKALKEPEKPKEPVSPPTPPASPPTPPAKPACFSYKGCDGKKDPCQFKPKPKPAEPTPPAKPQPEASHQAPVVESPAPATNPQDALKQAQIREIVESIVNADPRILDYIKEHDPELWKGFMEWGEKLLKSRQKSPVEETRFPTSDELLGMVYDYNTYWKAKTVLDLMARQDIRQQVEFKNRLECVSLALSTKPKNRDETFVMAWDLYNTIHQKIAEDKLLADVDRIEKTGEFIPLDQAAKELGINDKKVN